MEGQRNGQDRAQLAGGESRILGELHSPSSAAVGGLGDKERRPRCGWLFALLILLAAALFGCSVYIWQESRQEAPLVTPEPSVVEKVVYVREFDPDSGYLTTPELYARCAPSVVTVLTDGGVGSGFVISEDGYLATAAHVVEGAKNISVLFSDGSEYPAVVVGGSSLCDLALLKIEATGLSAVTFGSSSGLLIGERVVAIGTPASADYAGSVSSGEISYLNRTVRVREEDGSLKKTMFLLQTDATLNHGNSGCPLFDSYGRVVGIVTMKLGADYDGVGFAIPSDGAKALLEAWMVGDEPGSDACSAVALSAPRLGVLGSAGSENGVKGVRIEDFADGIWSASSMLRRDDLILGVNGTAVTTPEELRRAVEGYYPGDTVRVTVLRYGQQLSFDVVLGAQ